MVVLVDLASRICRELPRQALDNKAPTCCALLGMSPRTNALTASPLLAVGCNDGVVRLVHLQSLKVGRAGRQHVHAYVASGTIVIIQFFFVLCDTEKFGGYYLTVVWGGRFCLSILCCSRLYLSCAVIVCKE